MIRHIPEEFSTESIDRSPFVSMGNTTPPRDPDEQDEEDEEEEEPRLEWGAHLRLGGAGRDRRRRGQERSPLHLQPAAAQEPGQLFRPSPPGQERWRFRQQQPQGQRGSLSCVPRHPSRPMCLSKTLISC